MNREKWKTINDDYEVSNRGRVRNIETKVIEDTYINKNGYPSILILLNENKFLPLQIHRLVSKNFVENDEPKYKLFVQHIDNDKTNNNASNLKWVYEIDKTDEKELNDHEKLKKLSIDLDQKNKLFNIKSKKILDHQNEYIIRQNEYEKKKEKLLLKIVIFLSY